MKITENEQIGPFRGTRFCFALMADRRGLNTETQRHRENKKDKYDYKKTNPGEPRAPVHGIIETQKSSLRARK